MRFWVTICNYAGHILTTEIVSEMGSEIEARRSIIHDVQTGGGHVLKIEKAGMRLE